MKWVLFGKREKRKQELKTSLEKLQKQREQLMIAAGQNSLASNRLNVTLANAVNESLENILKGFKHD